MIGTKSRRAQRLKMLRAALKKSEFFISKGAQFPMMLRRKMASLEAAESLIIGIGYVPGTGEKVTFTERSELNEFFTAF